MDLETRELRYFVAVAEEQHFGRAAQRLAMAQPPLSRAIQQLERRLGVTLFERTTRSVQLTPAGHVLLAEGRKALAGMEAAVRSARRTGEGGRRLRVATKPAGDAGLMEEILRAYRDGDEASEPEVIVCGTGEAAAMLRDGRADVAFLHPPHDDLDDFDSELLLTQGQVAALPPHHRLAGRASIQLSDLDDEPLPVWPPRRASDAVGPTVRDPGQLLTLVALGQLVGIVPQSVQRLGRTDVSYVPVIDAPVSQVALCWPKGAQSSALTAFRSASATSASQPSRPAVAHGGRRAGAGSDGSARRRDR